MTKRLEGLARRKLEAALGSAQHELGEIADAASIGSGLYYQEHPYPKHARDAETAIDSAIRKAEGALSRLRDAQTRLVAARTQLDTISAMRGQL